MRQLGVRAGAEIVVTDLLRDSEHLFERGNRIVPFAAFNVDLRIQVVPGRLLAPPVVLESTVFFSYLHTHFTQLLAVHR